MPDEEKTNLEEEQVQSSEEATDEALTLEQLQGKKPEEILELYNNAVEMRKSATQKFMESAEDKKRFEAEREYLLGDRQRKDAELQRAYDQMSQQNTLVQQAGQAQPSSPRNYDELTPEQVYTQLNKENDDLKRKLSEHDQRWSKDKEELASEIRKTQSAIEYRDFLKEKIFPKYEFVTQRGLDDWFTDHPTIDPNPKTVQIAADEINKREDAAIEVRVQARLKEKAGKAEQTAIVTADSPLAALPAGKEMIDLPPAEQEEIIRRDIEQLQKK